MSPILDDHREIGNPGPWKLTCEEVMAIIRRKIAHPDEVIPGQAEALFHIHFCEKCKQYFTAAKSEVEEDR